jgi:serine/threonine-protein kinase
MRPTHNYVLGTRRSLAEVMSLQGRHAEADSMLRDVVKLEREELAKGHVEIGRALQAHGEVKLRLGDAASAEALLREALGIRTAALGGSHWLVAETESMLGEALAAQGRHAEAQPLLVGAYERLVAQRGAADRYTREARARLSR